MSEMSPLLRQLINFLRVGSICTAVLMAIFVCLFLWQKHTPDGFVFVVGDKGFLGIMLFLLVLAAGLAAGFSRELRR